MTKEGAKKHLEVIKAFADGKTIEYYNSHRKEWIIMQKPCFNENSEYRVKPEPAIRPYKNKEEFLQAFKEHGPFIKKCENLYSIQYVTNYYIVTCQKSYTFEDLVIQNIHWCDGTKCCII